MNKSHKLKLARHTSCQGFEMLAPQASSEGYIVEVLLVSDALLHIHLHLEVVPNSTKSAPRTELNSNGRRGRRGRRGRYLLDVSLRQNRRQGRR
jgi:hypothetical protein